MNLADSTSPTQFAIPRSDKDTLKKIDTKRELALKSDKTDVDRQKLDDLNDELGRLDFSHTVRDPQIGKAHAQEDRHEARACSQIRQDGRGPPETGRSER